MAKHLNSGCSKCPIQSKCIAIKDKMTKGYAITPSYCFFDDLIFDTLSLVMGIEPARIFLDKILKT